MRPTTKVWQKIGFVVAVMAIFATLATSCRTPKTIIKEVPVYLHDTTRVVQTDSIHTTDTVIRETETIIREADSATLAALGIQLKDNERAILVLKTELLQKIREMERMKTDSTYKHGETATPITTTEIKEVEKKLTSWQRFIMGAGIVFVGLLVTATAVGIIYVVKNREKKTRIFMLKREK